MNIQSAELTRLVSQIVGDSPQLLVAFLGILLCMVRATRPPRVRMAMACALLLMLANRLVLPTLYVKLRQHSMRLGGALDDAVEIAHNGRAILTAVAVGLLLYAAFTSDEQLPVVAGTEHDSHRDRDIKT
jgi:hypothetical protein